jgi:hypothetical protein
MPAAERGLQCAGIGLRDRPPSDCVQERVQLGRLVEAGELGHRGAFEDGGAGLQLPDNPEFFAKSIVFDGGHRDQMLRERAIQRSAGLDRGHDEAAISSLNQLARRGQRLGCCDDLQHAISL